MRTGFRLQSAPAIGWLCAVAVVTTPATAQAQEAGPLEGAWEVVYGRYGLPDEPVEVATPERPVQLKLFVSGRFAYVRQEADGPFQAASAGRYSVDGDRYTETTHWSSLPNAVGTRVTFEWRRFGDLLCVAGPVEVLDSQGDPVEDVPQMEEVLRRAGSDGGDRAACAALAFDDGASGDAE